MLSSIAEPLSGGVDGALSSGAGLDMRPWGKEGGGGKGQAKRRKSNFPRGTDLYVYDRLHPARKWKPSSMFGQMRCYNGADRVIHESEILDAFDIHSTWRSFVVNGDMQAKSW